MKKKGFTLIELLAVIVILAIIAVITVPKIADMISSSRMGGAEDSFYGTLKAAELGYTKALQSKTDLKGDTCDLSKVSGDKVTCTNGTVIAFTGKVPEKGTLIIDSAGSTIAKEITLNGYKCYGDLSTKNPCIKGSEKVISETLISKKTTSGDGIYSDSYEAERYVFKGLNPSNYLKFNNEVFRIISVEADGTIKIVKQANLGSRPYDKTGNRDKTSNGAGGTYCASSTTGCNVWAATEHFINGSLKGSVLKDSSLKEYLNNEYYNSLNNDAKSQIQAHNFYYGPSDSLSTTQTIKSTIDSEKKYTWQGKVGLIQTSDYLRATLSSTCVSIYDAFQTPDNCGRQNYLVLRDTQWPWFINSFPGINNSIFTMSENGFIYQASTGAMGDRGVWPAMFLNPNLQITGSGTSSDPYKII